MKPRAVVFDLDYTLWPCWCDTHLSPPLVSLSPQTIKDSSNYQLSFYKDVELIFKYLIENDIMIIGATRTHAPEIAHELLSRLHILGQPSISHFKTVQYGTNSKINHINNALKLLKEEQLAPSDLILFDDELRNKDVETIGVQFKHVPDGLNIKVFEEAINAFR